MTTLLLALITSATAMAEPTGKYDPKGYVDNCGGGTRCITVSGWAVKPGIDFDMAANVRVHVYKDAACTDECARGYYF